MKQDGKIQQEAPVEIKIIVGGVNFAQVRWAQAASVGFSLMVWADVKLALFIEPSRIRDNRCEQIANFPLLQKGLNEEFSQLSLLGHTNNDIAAQNDPENPSQ